MWQEKPIMRPLFTLLLSVDREHQLVANILARIVCFAISISHKTHH